MAGPDFIHLSGIWIFKGIKHVKNLYFIDSISLQDKLDTTLHLDHITLATSESSDGPLKNQPTNTEKVVSEGEKCKFTSQIMYGSRGGGEGVRTPPPLQN